MITQLNKAIKNILMATSIAAVSASTIASVGVQIPPPGPGQIPDYFGITPNFAESPAPAFATVSVTDSQGTGNGAVLAATTYDYNNMVYTPGITDVQIVNGGTDYSSSTQVFVNGAAGVEPIAVTPIIVNGTIVGISQFDQFTRDPTTGALTTTTNPDWVGSNLLTPYLQTTSTLKFNTPIAGTGIRKFVDALPGLALMGGVNSSYTGAYNFGGTDSNGHTIAAGQNNLGQQIPQATPDTTTFPDSDYYVIGVVDYKQKLHSDLPPTHLRGYVQLDANNQPIGKPQYMGPMIVAQKDRPVRVKMINMLTQSADNAGNKGKLPIPVDVTYMGADDTHNRTAMHLHGGNTPYISDGTPRQWVKPKGEGAGTMPADGSNVDNKGYNKGVSTANVPDMWFDVYGNLLANSSTCTQGTITCSTPGATNNPGDGALTFYFTNQQSARLMFYHDHAEGLTRLNVYAGVAAPFLLQDPTEQALVADGTIPSIEDTIPLIIQEKTFVPNDTIPVLNFYGAFKSQLNSQDPTWNWGALKAGFTDGIQSGGAQDKNGTGDLWVPHVFMTNQNPGDISGANSVGRWDYGPWFWPPFTGLDHGQVLNPYYDPACSSANNTMGWCEGEWIPGIPNGNTMTSADLSALYNAIPADATVLSTDVTTAIATQQTLSSPTGTPEAFNDTPLVNGTVYPYVNVDPKPYRFRILSISDDRALNLSLIVAASKTSDTTAAANAGANTSAILCDGSTGVNPADCTEAKMVPFDSNQNKYTPFPAHTRGDLQDNGWYTAQKAGVTFDGRNSGVYDPNTRGPAMVQIGVDGGFLSSPVQIYNKPINYEYNLKNIVVTNVKEHALLLGPAERADVVVDFTNFAGSTLLMYNDAPAALPAFDLRLDYYTGDDDSTDTGGTFSTVPGYGPNTRTLMQIRVSNNGGHANAAKTGYQDDLGVYGDGKGNIKDTLTKAIQAAFRNSQEPIIVPQAVYNDTYGNNVVDSIGGNISRISDSQLTYKPLLDPLTGAISSTPVTIGFQPKSIIEDWTKDYGRMTALLGVEMPHTSAALQTSSPMSFIDPPTEIVKMSADATPVSGQLADGTQIWKITHNGVDTHAIHFHLFHVQLINRVGWDGGLRPVELNEMGWKDIIRMNPLEDVIVALRPRQMTLPWKLGNSHHLLDPSKAANTQPDMFYNLNPVVGLASNVTNEVTNYGYEYLWHCHILGHEENDMMRSIIVANVPEDPTMLPITYANGNQFTVNWIDNSMTSNWVQIERASDADFTLNKTAINVIEPECNSQLGCNRSYTDTKAPSGSNFYRVTSMNTVGSGSGRQDLGYNPDGSYVATLPKELNGLLPGGNGGFTGYANQTAMSKTSASVGLTTSASVDKATINFGSQIFNTVSSEQLVTLTNVGALPLTVPILPTVTADYTITSDTCKGASLANQGTCSIGVKFTPGSAIGTLNGTLSIPTNDVQHNLITVALTGNVTTPIAAVSSAIDFGTLLTNTRSTTQTITLTNNGNAPLNISNFATAAPFALGTNPTNACSTATAIAAGGSCSLNVMFNPTSAGSQSSYFTFTDNSNGAAGSVQTIQLTGAGLAAVNPVISSAVLSTAEPAAVTVVWTASSSLTAQADSYQLQRGYQNNNNQCPTGTVYTSIGGATNALIGADATVAANTKYCYQVVATNAAGSFTSTAYALTTPAAPSVPTALTTRFTSPTSVTFGWAASTNATGYDVNVCANSACTTWTPVATGLPSTTTAISYATTPGVPYLFQVRASNPLTSAYATTAAAATYVDTATVNPASVSFGSVTTGTTSNATTITLTNTSLEPLTLTSATLLGANASEFKTANTCSASIAASGTCSITVNSVPTTAGAKVATLSLALTGTSTANVSQSVALSSTAILPNIATVVSATPSASSIDLLWNAPAAVNSTYTYQVQRTAALATTSTACPSTGYSNLSSAQTGLTYSDTTVIPGSKYCYQVVSSSTQPVNTATSNIIGATAVLPNLNATLAGTGSVGAANLSWTAPTPATSIAYTYQVMRAAPTTGTSCPLATATTGWANVGPNSSALTYTDTSVSALTSYCYKVVTSSTAISATGTSTVRAVTVPVSLPPATTTPTATAITPTSLTLNWTAPTTVAGNAIASYSVQRASDAGFTTGLVSNTVASGTTTLNVTGLTASTPYFFRVVSVNASGNTNSGTLTLTTPVLAPVATSAPTATLVTPNSLTLNWTAPTTGGAIASYTVQSATNTGFTSGLVTTALISNTATSYNVTGLAPSTTYYFRVIAVNATSTATSSALTQATAIAVPGVTGTPTATAITATGLTLNWSAPTTGGTVANYTVQYATNSSFTGATSSAAVTSTTYNVSGLTAGTTYWFRVVANNASASTNSSSVSATTMTAVAQAAALATLPAPATVTGLSGVTTDRVISAGMNWSAVSGATSYNVRYSTSSTFATSTTVTATSGSQIAFTGIVSKATVYLQVRAVGATTSAWSATVAAIAQ